MRVPGFVHAKSGQLNGHVVRIISVSHAQPYRAKTAEEIWGEGPAPIKRTELVVDLQSSTISLNDVAEALTVIPSDDRQTWMEVGMALKDQYGDSAYKVFDEWSTNSSKYQGTDDTKLTWESFQGEGITIGTLLHHAKEHGWNGMPPPKQTVSNTDLANARRIVTHHGNQMRYTTAKGWFESRRVCRRLQLLRGWSDEQSKQILPGSPGTCGSDGVRA